MLVFNKYLKELGYEKDDFPSKRLDNRFKPDKHRGVVPAQTWNLDITIALELYTYLRYFQEECMDSDFPICFASEENGKKHWHQVAQDIIDGLKAYVGARELHASDFKTYEDYSKAYEELYDKFEKGWALLGEYFADFWW